MSVYVQQHLMLQQRRQKAWSYLPFLSPTSCDLLFPLLLPQKHAYPLSSELAGELNFKEKPTTWHCWEKWVFLCQTSLQVVEPPIWKRWKDQRRGGGSLLAMMWSFWVGLDIMLNCILSLLCRWITLYCKNLCARRELWHGMVPEINGIVLGVFFGSSFLVWTCL